MLQTLQGMRGCQLGVDESKRATSVLWLGFHEEPKATSKAKALYDNAFGNTFLAVMCMMNTRRLMEEVPRNFKYSGQRSGVSLVLVHWVNIKNKLFVYINNAIFSSLKLENSRTRFQWTQYLLTTSWSTFR